MIRNMIEERGVGYETDFDGEAEMSPELKA